MKKILLMIITSSGEIFKKDTKTLINNYKNTIRDHQLCIDVISVSGRLEGRDDYFENLVVDIDERDMAGVLFKTIEIVGKSNYDVIVKTNTSTVVNLQLLQQFCDSQYFDDSKVYTLCFCLLLNNYFQNYDEQYRYHKANNLIEKAFPIGEFIMAAGGLWKKILNNYSAAKLQYGIYSDPNQTYQKEHNLEWVILDDIMCGICIDLTGIKQGYTFTHNVIGETKKDRPTPNWVDGFDDRSLATVCKLELTNISPDINLKIRNSYESVMLDMICKLYNMHNFKQEDLQYNLDKMLLFDLN